MNKKARTAFLFILPVTILLFGVCLYPLCYGIGISFSNYNFLKPNVAHFNGLKNYIKIFTRDKSFYGALSFSFLYALSTVLFSYILGLVCAVLMNKDIKLRGIFRALLLLPWITPSVVAANTWISILNPDIGIINLFLLKIHLINSPIPFLANSMVVKFTTIMVGTWKSYPFMMLVLLAGMQSIPQDIYESARVDGATKIQQFFCITLPLLKPVTMVSTVLMTIWNFNNFDMIYLLTKGGPINASTTISIYAYNNAFYRNELGYASAISVVMMILMMIMSCIYIRQLHREV